MLLLLPPWAAGADRVWVADMIWWGEVERGPQEEGRPADRESSVRIKVEKRGPWEDGRGLWGVALTGQ